MRYTTPDHDSFWTRIKRSFHSSRRAQVVALMLADALVIVCAIALAYLARFEGNVPQDFARYSLPAALATVTVVICAVWIMGLYHVVLRYVGIQVMGRLAAGMASAFLVLVVLDTVLSGGPNAPRMVPYGVFIFTAAFSFIGLAALRSIGRLWVLMAGAASTGSRRVLIVGAGDAGSLLLRDIENQPQLGYAVLGLLDDAPEKQNLWVRSVRVIGVVNDLPHIVEALQIEEVLLAIPSMDANRRREMLELCADAGVPTRMITGIAPDAASTGVANLHAVKIEDLLGREPNEIDIARISQTLAGKVVAVTGAAGSIGSELCRQIMAMRPACLLLVDVDESRLYELYLEMQGIAVGVARMRLCDVRDARKLLKVFRADRPQVIFHAAAYKHVPLLEDEPEEAIRANILGTMNVLRACGDVSCERFVLISTDKAVQPRNVMGATKAVAELLTLAAARFGIGAVAVRFGNVLGSRGSVVPIFEEQLRNGGPLLVTHPDITRYFMTIPEASRLVLQAQAMSEGGDIFVLDMGEPVKIVDLAQRMIVLSGASASIEYTGLRPGEKMHEVLVHGDSGLMETDCPSVRRLSCLPLVPEAFSGAVAELLVLARLGDSPNIKASLSLLASATFEVDEFDGARQP